MFTDFAIASITKIKILNSLTNYFCLHEGTGVVQSLSSWTIWKINLLLFLYGFASLLIWICFYVMNAITHMINHSRNSSFANWKIFCYLIHCHPWAFFSFLWNWNSGHKVDLKIIVSEWVIYTENSNVFSTFLGRE